MIELQRMLAGKSGYLGEPLLPTPVAFDTVVEGSSSTGAGGGETCWVGRTGPSSPARVRLRS